MTGPIWFTMYIPPFSRPKPRQKWKNHFNSDFPIFYSVWAVHISEYTDHLYAKMLVLMRGIRNYWS